MTRSFIRLLTLLALLFAPLGMIASHAAMATPTGSTPAAAPTMHCAEMAQDQDQAPGKQMPTKNIDCLIACACLPPLGAPAVGQEQLFVSMDPFTGAEALGHGLNFAADPPPPRLS